MASRSLRYEVVGLKELMYRLGALSDRAIKKNVRKALTESTKPMISGARSLVPVRYGFLKKAIGMVIRVYDRATVAVLGARRDTQFSIDKGKARFRHSIGKRAKRFAVPAFYAHLVEFGTKPHALGEGSIRVRRSRRRSGTVELGAGPQRGPMHPGAAPSPFLEPAWRSNREASVQIIARVLSDAIKGAA